MTRTLLLSAVVATFALSPVALAETKPAFDQDERAQLREILAKQRKTNLARFKDYRLKKVYPHNTYEPGLKNVWIDLEGHLCAVATLMKIDGKDALVETTGKTDNFVRVAQLTSGPVIDWVLTSGFTQEEIVMIQQPSAAEVWMWEQQQLREERKLARARAREDARLAKNYRATEKALASETMANAGLDLAVERLVQKPELAKALLAAK